MSKAVIKKTPPVILYFLPSVSGGLFEYARYQADALQLTGVKVFCLVAPAVLNASMVGVEMIHCLCDPLKSDGGLIWRKIKMLGGILWNFFALAWQIIQLNPDLVLLDSYCEYLAPIWVWPHWILARIFGVRYAANLHDPVRNYVVGPLWWHRWSVKIGYWFLDFILVHNALPETSLVPKRIRVIQVPHGLLEIKGLSVNASEIRQRWGVKPGQKVFLSFGYVRDGKNLDLSIRALVDVPDAFLVVAGSVASSKDKDFDDYRELSARLGVLERCHFVEGFVVENELKQYFEGADFVLLTYSSTFHSQSGVLNIAAKARKPVLASAAPGPLIEAVKKFQLGFVVEPDSFSSITIGMQELIEVPMTSRWEDYEEAASWSLNAQRIIQAAGFQ